MFIILEYSGEAGDEIAQECQILFTDEIFKIPSIAGETMYI